MKNFLLYIFVLAIMQTGLSQTVFENFDNCNMQTKYIIKTQQETPDSKITLFRQPVDDYEDDNALGIKYDISAEFSWGGNAMVEFINPDTNNGVWDFSGYQSISFDLNNKIKCTKSSKVYLEFILFDVSNAPHNTKDMSKAEFWISYLYVLDLDPGWNTYNLDLDPVSKTVDQEKPSSGFWHSDSEGIRGNDRLDLNKIAGIGLEFHWSSSKDSTIADGEILLDNIFLNGKTSSTLAGVNTGAVNSNCFRLNQNYPNPFNPSTNITFNIAKQENVKLNVYDILGKEVAVLVNKNMAPGEHSVVFNAANLPSGIYIYRLQAGEYTQTKKLLLLK